MTRTSVLLIGWDLALSATSDPAHRCHLRRSSGFARRERRVVIPGEPRLRGEGRGSREQQCRAATQTHQSPLCGVASRQHCCAGSPFRAAFRPFAGNDK